MNKVIEIYSLGERMMTLMTLSNAVGYNVFWLNDGQEAHLRKKEGYVRTNSIYVLMRKLVAEGFVIRVKRLFYITVPTEYEVYERKIYDSALNFLRYFRDESVPYILEDSKDMRRDLDTLLVYSPPLHEKAIEHLGKGSVSPSSILLSNFAGMLKKEIKRRIMEDYNSDDEDLDGAVQGALASVLELIDSRLEISADMWSEEDRKKWNRIYSILGQAADTHAFSTTCRLLGDKECVELQDFIRAVTKPLCGDDTKNS